MSAAAYYAELSLSGEEADLVGLILLVGSGLGFGVVGEIVVLVFRFAVFRFAGGFSVAGRIGFIAVSG